MPEDSIVPVHPSLRDVGSIDGGPAVLLDALIEHFTKGGGLLCIPTHTWHNLGKEITLDMTSIESCLGALATIALQDGRGIRSENPSHSIVVFGDREKAEAFIQDETVITSPTATTQLCDAAKLKDTVALLYQISNGMDPLAGEMPIPQKWYCQ